MSTIVYIILTIVTLFCAVFLFRGYRRVKTQLLFWAGLFFIGYTLNSLLVISDKIIFPQVDMYLYRLLLALISTLMLLYGLIFKIR